MNKKILVTGSSGFIGMSLCKSLLEDGHKIIGVDNMNDYYDPKLKESRLLNLFSSKNFLFEKVDIANYAEIERVFKSFSPEIVVNLAAQAGVRESLKNPHSYISSNVVGFMNILECCRLNKIEGLIYASSSSVYGKSKESIFSVDHRTDTPISIYAATKKSNELMAYSYNNLYNLRSTGLRFFTVYGPWGRPDMAIYKFTEKLFENRPITLFNHGEMVRDFTYIDDVVGGIRAAIEKNYKFEIFNLGNDNSIKISKVVSLIEKNLKKEAEILFKDIQLGDIEKTQADLSYSRKMLNYHPKVDINEGILNFINWYKKYNSLPQNS